MARPQTPSGASRQSEYEDKERVWVIYDTEWELGTIEGVAVSSGESKRYTVKRDAAPAFPSGIDIEYIRKKNQVMSVLMVVVWEKAVRSFGKRLR